MPRRIGRVVVGAALALLVGGAGTAGYANEITIPIELVFLNLQGSFGGQTITVQVGETFGVPRGSGEAFIHHGDVLPSDPPGTHHIDSFFDVFFGIKIGSGPLVISPKAAHIELHDLQGGSHCKKIEPFLPPFGCGAYSGHVNLTFDFDGNGFDDTINFVFHTPLPEGFQEVLEPDGSILHIFPNTIGRVKGELDHGRPFDVELRGPATVRVPSPGTLSLLLAGAAALRFFRKRS